MEEHRVRIERVPYPAGTFCSKAEDSLVLETEQWVRSRLSEAGFATDPWATEGGRALSAGNARALHLGLTEIVERAVALDISTGSDLTNHTVRWVLNRQASGIVRCLTECREPLDGSVFARLFEWHGWLVDGAVGFFLWYAPMKTLRSIEVWLHELTASPHVPVSDRVLMLRPLGRLDPAASVAIASELLVQSPYLASEVLGMFGGPHELELMRRALPEVASNEEARTRRHFEAGIRKLERKLEQSQS